MIDKPNIIPSGDSILIIRSLKKITSDKLNSILDRINSANISEVAVSYTHLTLPTKA